MGGTWETRPSFSEEVREPDSGALDLQPPDRAEPPEQMGEGRPETMSIRMGSGGVGQELPGAGCHCPGSLASGVLSSVGLGPTPDKHRPGSWDTVQEAAAPAPQLLGDLSRSSSWGGSPSLYLGTFHPGPGAQEGSVVLICWHPGTFMRM